MNKAMKLTAEQLEFWNDNGYLLLKNFYSSQDIENINALVDRLWKKRSKIASKHVIDIFVETANERRVYLADAPSSARRKPYKLNDLYLSEPEIRELIVGEKVAPILRELLEGFPMVCNSLNFEFGSQQEFHFDTFYMPSPTPNKMIASWIALEDTSSQNGPLQYYPGSHKIPPYLFSHGTTHAVPQEMPQFDQYINSELEKRNLKPEVLIANKGDLLIWHSQLFHGGSPILDKRKTRKSLVTHYFTNEDFPELDPPKVCQDGGYMDRDTQAVVHQPKFKNWLQRTFG